MRNQNKRLSHRTGLDIYRSERNRISRNIKAAILEFNDKRWTNKLTKLKVSDNTLWQKAKAFTKKSTNATPTLHEPNGLTFSDQEKANFIAQQFVSVHHLTETLGNNRTETVVKETLKSIIQKPIDLDLITLISPRGIYSIIEKNKTQ